MDLSPHSLNCSINYRTPNGSRIVREHENTVSAISAGDKCIFLRTVHIHKREKENNIAITITFIISYSSNVSSKGGCEWTFRSSKQLPKGDENMSKKIRKA